MRFLFITIPEMRFFSLTSLGLPRSRTRPSGFGAEPGILFRRRDEDDPHCLLLQRSSDVRAPVTSGIPAAA